MEIRIFIEGEEPKREHIIYSEEPISLVDAMTRAHLNFYRPCGGNVRCMRCGVHFLYGAPEITAEDDRALDFSEIRNGWRLGCKCIIKDDCRIEVPAHLCSSIKSEALEKDLSEIERAAISEEGIAIALDIGTTTVAAALVELKEHRILGSTSVANSQIKYGADVMTRIESALKNQSSAGEMMGMVRDDTLKAVGTLTNNLSNIKLITVSGNTTMMHLALGFPVDGLAAFPFKPFSLEPVVSEERGRDLYTLPCISAFVGSDVVAGLYALDVMSSPQKSLLVDLGTNAEIVLWDGNRFWATSAAAGPALEGGNISHGVPSVAGAIDHVKIDLATSEPYMTTIGGAKPIGICGSGIVDAIYEMYKAGIIDNGGLMQGEYSYSNFKLCDGVEITAEDVQHVLLAKSAIYSGIAVLLKQAGVEAEEIENLYVAGGLGASISPDAAVGLGMFPQVMIDKYQSVGNSSLRGAVKFAEEKDMAPLKKIVDSTTVVELSNISDFENMFLQNLFI